MQSNEIQPAVERELGAAKFIDVHTHLFMPSLGRLGLWGIDELITYHYLEAELFRSSNLKPEQYWHLSIREKADISGRRCSWKTSPSQRRRAEWLRSERIRPSYQQS